MLVLVTGGAGFIGSHVVDLLVEKGHDVVVLDDLSTGRKENVNPEATLTVLNVRSTEAAQMVRGGGFDAVLHLAAQISVVKSVQEPVFDAKVNILGSINLLEAAAEGGVKRFLFASTGGAIYGEQSVFPADESHICQPDSPYGTAKYCVEQYLRLFRGLKGLPTLALRFANVYGPRQDPHGEAGVVAIFCRRLLAGEETVIYGTGEQTRDFVYVGDVARANLLALDSEVDGVINIGTGRELSVNKVHEVLAGLAGADGKPRYEEARPGELFRSCIDPARAKEVLEWEPTVELEEGLGKTLDWFRLE